MTTIQTAAATCMRAFNVRQAIRHKIFACQISSSYNSSGLTGLSLDSIHLADSVC